MGEAMFVHELDDPADFLQVHVMKGLVFGTGGDPAGCVAFKQARRMRQNASSGNAGEGKQTRETRSQKPDKGGDKG